MSASSGPPVIFDARAAPQGLARSEKPFAGADFLHAAPPRMRSTAWRRMLRDFPEAVDLSAHPGPVRAAAGGQRGGSQGRERKIGRRSAGARRHRAAQPLTSGRQIAGPDRLADEPALGQRPARRADADPPRAEAGRPVPRHPAGRGHAEGAARSPDRGRAGGARRSPGAGVALRRRFRRRGPVAAGRIRPAGRPMSTG